MAEIVELAEWRRRVKLTSSRGEERSDHDVERLEEAVHRLSPLVSHALDRRGQLEEPVETELLAIMGELTVGLVREAATRAERLAQRMQASMA